MSSSFLSWDEMKVVRLGIGRWVGVSRFETSDEWFARMGRFKLGLWDLDVRVGAVRKHDEDGTGYKEWRLGSEVEDSDWCGHEHDCCGCWRIRSLGTKWFGLVAVSRANMNV
jgi:hypothetical protein